MTLESHVTLWCNVLGGACALTLQTGGVQAAILREPFQMYLHVIWCVPANVHFLSYVFNLGLYLFVIQIILNIQRALNISFFLSFLYKTTDGFLWMEVDWMTSVHSKGKKTLLAYCIILCLSIGMFMMDFAQYKLDDSQS